MAPFTVFTLFAVISAALFLSSCADTLRWLVDWKSPPEGYPTNISVSKSTRADGIFLTWEKPQWSESYRVYRAPDLWSSGNFDREGFAFVAETEDLEFLDTGVEPDRNYFYEISALSPHGVEGSRDGSSWSFGSRRGAYGAAPIPYDLKANDGDFNAISLTWRTGVPVNSTSISASLSPDSNESDWIFIGSAEGESFRQLPDLPLGMEEKEALRGVRYYYWAKNSFLVDGQYEASAPSLMASGYLWGGILSMPREFKAEVQGSDVRLTWTKPDICSTFRIFRATNAQGTDRIAAYSPGINGQVNGATSFVDTPPAPGSYWYWISNIAYTETGTVYSDEALCGPAYVP